MCWKMCCRVLVLSSYTNSLALYTPTQRVKKARLQVKIRIRGFQLGQEERRWRIRNFNKRTARSNKSNFKLRIPVQKRSHVFPVRDSRFFFRHRVFTCLSLGWDEGWGRAPSRFDSAWSATCVGVNESTPSCSAQLLLRCLVESRREQHTTWNFPPLQSSTETRQDIMLSRASVRRLVLLPPSSHWSFSTIPPSP